MKQLLILMLLFTACAKQLNTNIVTYKVTPTIQQDKWRFTVTLDRNLHLSGYVSFDILFETSIGKQSTIHQNLDLGVIVNNPITYISEIDAKVNTKVLSIKSEIILYDNDGYVFVQQ